MKSLKRLFMVMMALAICVFGTSFAYAEDVTAVPDLANSDGNCVTSVDVVVEGGDTDSGIMPMSYNNVLAFRSTTFSWDGQCDVVLGWRASNCGFKAGISSNDSVGNVHCFVKYPDGSMVGLGTVPSSGGMTHVVPCGSLPSGTYTFYFESSNGATLTGIGYIVQ